MDGIAVMCPAKLIAKFGTAAWFGGAAGIGAAAAGVPESTRVPGIGKAHRTGKAVCLGSSSGRGHGLIYMPMGNSYAAAGRDATLVPIVQGFKYSFAWAGTKSALFLAR
jgi:hypothetical protein